MSVWKPALSWVPSTRFTDGLVSMYICADVFVLI